MKISVPYFSEKTNITVQNEIVEVKAFQVIVWVSITTEEVMPWDPRTPRLPAILDTGTTHNFALTDAHLRAWAGIHAANLRELGRMRVETAKATLHGAGLWLHTGADPFRLDVYEGIGVFDGNWPRLPVLGLRALTNSKLQTFI